MNEQGNRARTSAVEAGIEYLRVERVARFLDISKKRVYQLVQEGRLAAVRLGPRQMRISRPSLDAYVIELQVDSARDDAEQDDEDRNLWAGDCA